MKRFAFAIVFLLAISLAPAATATVARAVAFDQKVEQAETIVLGRCIRRVSKFDPSGRWILTYSTFAVSKAYKGSPAREITVVTPGGQVEDLHQETVGVPRFGEGDVNVLFIRATRFGPSVLFFDQGAYSVAGDAATSSSIVAPIQSRLVLIDPVTGSQRNASEAEPPRTLGEFEQQIGRVLDRHGRVR